MTLLQKPIIVKWVTREDGGVKNLTKKGDVIYGRPMSVSVPQESVQTSKYVCSNELVETQNIIGF